jgi:hypothetical protein
MGMSVIIESINTNRFPGPVDIIYGYIVDNGGDSHQFCLEHDIHGWDFDEKTSMPDELSVDAIKNLVLKQALPIFKMMQDQE